MAMSDKEREELFQKRLAHVKRPWWGRGFDEEMAPVFASIEEEKQHLIADASQGDASWGECSERLMQMLEARIAAGVERVVIPEIEKDNERLVEIVGHLQFLEQRVQEPELLKSLPESGDWVGPDVFITSSEAEANAQEGVAVILSRLAGPISWLMQELREAGEGYLDRRNKFEYFGEIAAAIGQEIEAAGDGDEQLPKLLALGVKRAREVVEKAAERQRGWIGELAAECRIRQGEVH